MDFKTIWANHERDQLAEPGWRSPQSMDEEIWKGLLRTALAILDDLEAQGDDAPEVAMGGGTVLMMRMRHRLSRDIDFFMHDARWLARLTPRLNDRVGAMVRDYSE